MIQSLKNFFTRSGVTQAKNSFTLSPFYGISSISGPSVTTDSALRCSAVMACVKVISESVASLPLHLYERLPAGGKDRAYKHPLYSLLHDTPNPELTCYEFLELVLSGVLLYGNAYFEIERNGSGRPIALWPMVASNTSVIRIDGKTVYAYRVNNETIRLTSDQVLHIRALSTDGLTGLSPLSYARESIGLSLATEEFAARFFVNGSNAGKVFEHPGRMTEEAQARFRASIDASHTGLSNSHRMLLLEEGMKFSSSGIPPRDAQFLEMRQFQIAEIARIFRVPLHMIGDLSRSTNNNIEHQSLEFVVHTLRPWLVKIEQSFNRALLSESERGKYFCEFSLDGLLRGDSKTRAEALQIQRINGIISANEWRKLENLNPIENGDVYITPLNMAPAGSQPTEPAQRSARHAGQELADLFRGREERSQEFRAKTRHSIQTSFVPVIGDAVERILRREVQDVRNLLKKHLRDATTLTAALETFYSDHKEFVGKNIRASVVALSSAICSELEDELGMELRNNPKYLQFVEDFITGYAGRFTQASYKQLAALIRESLDSGADINEVVEQRLTEWQETRPGKESRNESVRIGGAIARTLFVLAGASTLVWRNVGETCDICRPLNGKTVGHDQPFANDGDTFNTLKVNRKVLHPPLHRGCDCTITRG